MPNVAIFGGTFDPIHWGHLLIAETALDQFHLDRVIWVPTFCPPHKVPPLVSFKHRLAMLSSAIADQPAFNVSTIDSQQQGTSYAVETFNALQTLEPNACWYWIVGNDAFHSLPKWKDSQALAAQCTWLVAPRVQEQRGKRAARESREIGNNHPKASTLPPYSHLTPPSALIWHHLEMPSIEISSSLIRQRCQDGRSIRYLVPESVRCYITEKLLYQMS
ncbi:MAG: nicotinate (nicotinamide) nucleotide adenylyltransferase [Stenomitos frigidus ULC029]